MKVEKERKERRSEIRLTDFIAICFAILLTPLMVMRKAEPDLVQMAVNLKLYPSKDIGAVKAPLLAAQIQHQLQGQMMTIPHLLVPSYSDKTNQSALDAVAFVGLQKEMLYSQRFAGMRYKNPYVAHRAHSEVVSAKAEKKELGEDESVWKKQAYYFSAPTTCAGSIKTLHENRFERTIFGMTDRQEVFKFDNQLNTISVIEELSRQIQKMCLKQGLTVVNQKLTVEKDSIFAGLLLKNKNDGATFAFYRLDRGTVTWSRQAMLLAEDLVENFEDPILSPVMLSTKRGHPTPFKLLREVLQKRSSGKPGQTQAVFVTPEYFVFRNKQLFVILDKETGEEVQSFTIKVGVKMWGDADGIYLQYLSDQHMIGTQAEKKRDQRFDLVSMVIQGDTLSKLNQTLHFVAHLSEQSVAIEQQMKTDYSHLAPTQMNLVRPTRFTTLYGQRISVFLAPNGQLAAIDSTSGKKLWIAQVPDFIPTSMGTAMSTHSAGKLTLLVLQLGERVYVYNAQKGTLMGQWLLENATLYDTSSFFYDDDEARARTAVLVERFHPFVDKKALFLIKDNMMSVYGIEQEGIALTAFWERLMLVGLASVVLALFFRQMSVDMVQKE